MDDEKKGMGSAVAKGKELSEKIMDIPTPVGGTLHDVKEMSKDAVKKTAEKSKEMAKKTAEKSMDVAIKTREKSKEIAHKTAEKGAEVAKKTAEKGAEVAKKTAEKSKKAVTDSKKAMDKRISADQAVSRREYLLILFNFFGPFAGVITIFICYYIFLPNSTANHLLASSGIYFIPSPAGDKTVLISTAPGFHGYGKYIMALNLAVMDTLLAWFLTFNIDLVKRWRGVGRIIVAIENKSKGLFEKHQWLRKIAVVFIALFVLIPFQGSGGLSASIIGRLMGLKPWKVLIAVSVGALTGCMAIAYMVDTITKYFSTTVQITIFVVFVALITLFFLYSYRKGKRTEAQENPI